jgi:dTDP-4-amino-4,6-dideoxygalactose transaminase
MTDNDTLPFLVFGAPQVDDSEIKEVEACLRSGWLGTGPRVAAFESAFAQYKGTAPSKVAAVNSCTAALHLSMVAAKIEPGAEVITTPLTFCATVNAIIHAGLTPVLADVDAASQNIDPAAIEASITPRTRAILPVHFAGRPCEMDAIMALAKKHGLLVIEDCAHAVESEYKGRKTGTFGQFGCFSFYVTKNMTTGEGGMILSNSDEYIARARILALHGLSKDAWHRFGDKGYRHYQVVECGFKYNMMDIQAAIGIHQLSRIEENWLRRQTIWSGYMDAFSDLPIALPAAPEAHMRHAYHLFTIQLSESLSGISQDDFLQEMTARRIGIGVHYRSIPEHPYYQQRFGWNPQQYRNAFDIGRTTVSLPLSARLTDRDVERVIEAVRSIVERRKQG